MPEGPDASGTAEAIRAAEAVRSGDGPSVVAGEGRALTVGVTMLAYTVGVISLLVGALLAVAGLAGQVFSAWKSAGR
ncbi:hypothetical protein ACGF4C_15905 [Streptomyces sp. NPDC048197]|uniref:hypothetical protein n=1 Tax=Streptomyces sp. NPDC048197 TaxID=3365511 RepID=UPI00372038FD